MRVRVGKKTACLFEETAILLPTPNPILWLVSCVFPRLSAYLGWPQVQNREKMEDEKSQIRGHLSVYRLRPARPLFWWTFFGTFAIDLVWPNFFGNPQFSYTPPDATGDYHYLLRFCDFLVSSPYCCREIPAPHRNQGAYRSSRRSQV